MSVGTIKLLATTITGTTGLGIVSPFVYTEAIRPSYQTLWRKKLNAGSSIISYSESGYKYSLELITVGEG